MVVSHQPILVYGENMADINLLHLTFREDTMFYFYDGELPVKKGVLVIDDKNEGLVRRAWALGYRLDPKSEEEISADSLQNRLETGAWETPVKAPTAAQKAPITADKGEDVSKDQ